MSWGAAIEGAVIGWGRTFHLGVDNLDIDMSALSGRLPVLGRSGSGKSTLLYLLSFLKYPTRGWVRWLFPDGERAVWGRRGLELGSSSVTITQIRRRYFGFSYQRSTLTPYLRVRENLRYPLMLQDELSEQEINEQVYLAVSQVLLCGQNGGSGQEGDSMEALMERYPRSVLVVGAASLRDGDATNIFRMFEAGALDLFLEPLGWRSEDVGSFSRELTS
ncbi:MAG: ATP-binding cassette domain-containing protein, partial [Magnetococcales bacterium]|nr:ATP-binding cassette domain-containing protein [Magnetococcales bacterium]